MHGPSSPTLSTNTFALRLCFDSFLVQADIWTCARSRLWDAEPNNNNTSNKQTRLKVNSPYLWNYTNNISDQKFRLIKLRHWTVSTNNQKYSKLTHKKWNRAIFSRQNISQVLSLRIRYSTFLDFIQNSSTLHTKPFTFSELRNRRSIYLWETLIGGFWGSKSVKCSVGLSLWNVLSSWSICTSWSLREKRVITTVSCYLDIAWLLTGTTRIFKLDLANLSVAPVAA